MVEEIYPENLLSLGSGGIVKDGDRFWFIWVNPELQLRIAKDRLDMKGKVIAPLDGLDMLSSSKKDDQVNRDRFVVAYAKENLCEALKKNKSYKAVSYEIKKPFRKFRIDTYEFAPNESRSYIKVVPSEGNEHGFPIEVGEKSCESVVEEMVLGAVRQATMGFHRNY